jgi:hypothetical protein
VNAELNGPTKERKRGRVAVELADEEFEALR